MSRIIIRNFYQYINQLDDFQHLVLRIAGSAGPTLFNLKPSFLIAIGNKPRDLAAIWDKYQRDICSQFRLKCRELVYGTDRRLVLFYQEKSLNNYLNIKDNRSYLENIGYPVSSGLTALLDCLNGRLANGFPHEIGIFLGYPMEDVRAFIEHKGKDYLLSRYWKVYSHPRRAERIFHLFDLARLIVIMVMLDPGYSLDFAEFLLIESANPPAKGL